MSKLFSKGSAQKADETEQDEEYEYECSACGGLVDDSQPYCPHCGARLRHEGEPIPNEPSQTEYRMSSIFDYYFGALIIYWSCWIAPIAFFLILMFNNNGMNVILALPLLIMAFLSGRPLWKSIKYKHTKTPGVVFKMIGFVRYLMLLWVFGFSIAGLVVALMMKLNWY